MISRVWKDKYLPTAEVRPVTELWSTTEKLDVYTVNGDVSPFDGWTVTTINLQGTDNNKKSPLMFLF